MKTRLPVFLLAALAIAQLFVLTLPALAQDADDETWYLRPRVGVSWYLGDNDKEPMLKPEDNFNTFPYNLGLEVGYKFSSTYSVGLAVSGAKYGAINDFDRNPDTELGEDQTKIHVELLARHRYGRGKIAPYVEAGGAVAFGETSTFPTLGTESSEVAFGPVLGFGIDLNINDRASLGFGFAGAYVFGDAKADGTENDDSFGPTDGGFGPGDLLGRTTLGLNINLKTFKPVMVTDQICPADVILIDTPTTFTASVNEEATRPVSATWDFGDGSVASGLTATHSFSEEGSYDVIFRATNGNGRGNDSRTCTVTVEDPCDEAEVVSMSASTMTPDTETAIGFMANVAGSEPMSYMWDFGDGNTSMDANPSHTYDEPGDYEVTLVVENCAGRVERSMTISVALYEAAICREITEMNSVFFERNSSALTEEGRALLQENLEILLLCPNLNARLEGFAAPGERRPQELSTARARAVEQFYVDNGVAASRLVTVGMGRAQGMTSKKEGLSQFRRVDTIPVRN